MNTNIWIYISATASIVIGWLLNEFGQLVKIRRENKKIRKKVLFLLLEIRYTFSLLNNDKIIEKLSEKILSRLPPEVNNEEGRAYITEIYKKLMPKILEPDVANNLSGLEESYRKALEEFSGVDPVSAYWLKGKNNILDILKSLTEYFAYAQEMFPAQRTEIEAHAETLLDNIKPEIIVEAIDELVDEIKDLALQIGVITRFRVDKVLKKIDSNVNDPNRLKKLDDYLDKNMPTF